MRRCAVNQPPAQRERPDGERQPQPQPEAGLTWFGSSPTPRHTDGDGLTELSDLHKGQLTDRAMYNGHNGSLVVMLEEQTQTTLEQAEALLCQEVGAEDEEEAAASLHGVQDGV